MSPIPEEEKPIPIHVNPDKKWCLKSLENVPEEYRQLVKAIIKELEKDGENPSEFHASLVLHPNGSKTFHLWHESAFKAIEEAQKKGLGIMGNPGGRCRDFMLDPDNNIIKKWFWE